MNLFGPQIHPGLFFSHLPAGDAEHTVAGAGTGGTDKCTGSQPQLTFQSHSLDKQGLKFMVKGLVNRRRKGEDAHRLNRNLLTGAIKPTNWPLIVQIYVRVSLCSFLVSTAHVID